MATTTTENSKFPFLIALGLHLLALVLAFGGGMVASAWASPLLAIGALAICAGATYLVVQTAASRHSAKLAQLFAVGGSGPREQAAATEGLLRAIEHYCERKSVSERAARPWFRGAELRTLLDTLPLPILLASADGMALAWNRALEEYLPELRRAPSLAALLGADVINALSRCTGSGHEERAAMALAGQSFEVRVSSLVIEDELAPPVVSLHFVGTREASSALGFASMIGAAGVGNFSGRLSLDGSDAFQKTVAQSVNNLLQTTEERLSDVGRVLSAMASGDLTQTVRIDFEAGALALARQFHAYLSGAFTLDPTESVAAGNVLLPTLRNGSTVLNGNLALVDDFTDNTGSLATIFVRNGDDFVRVATSVKTETGERAIGTRLDRSHPAYAAGLAGRRFLGPANLFGSNYMAAYDPVLDARRQVIGMLFIGFDLSPRRNLFIGLCDAIAETVAKLTQTIGDIKAVGASIHAAVRELAYGNAALEERTERQVKTLERTSSAMGALTADAQRNAQSAHAASEFAIEASAVAKRGGTVVEEVVQTMDSISASSKRIADIISVIDGIAFQTNILALNAAVEAARAGEQGRGFAVVAGEVRSLSQRSADAAREIKQLIGDSVTSVAEGGRLVAQAGDTMTEIVLSAERVTQVLSEIAAGSAGQTAHIDGVNLALAQMQQATQQNAELAAGASQATIGLEEQVEHLAQSMAFFRTDAKLAA